MGRLIAEAIVLASIHFTDGAVGRCVLTVYETHSTPVTKLAGRSQSRRSQTKQESARNSGRDVRSNHGLSP